MTLLCGMMVFYIVTGMIGFEQLQNILKPSVDQNIQIENSKDEMVNIEDFLGQYDSYLQGAN